MIYCITCLVGSMERDSEKYFKYIFLVVSGPLLLGISLYGFAKNNNLGMDLYALSFLSWWIIFSVSIYCTFKLTLSVAIYYHKKKNAKFYESIENPSYSPLIR